jgi:hypothetical protein
MLLLLLPAAAATCQAAVSPLLPATTSQPRSTDSAAAAAQRSTAGGLAAGAPACSVHQAMRRLACSCSQEGGEPRWRRAATHTVRGRSVRKAWGAEAFAPLPPPPAQAYLCVTRVTTISGCCQLHHCLLRPGQGSCSSEAAVSPCCRPTQSKCLQLCTDAWKLLYVKAACLQGSSGGSWCSSSNRSCLSCFAAAC